MSIADALTAFDVETSRNLFLEWPFHNYNLLRFLTLSDVFWRCLVGFCSGLENYSLFHFWVTVLCLNIPDMWSQEVIRPIIEENIQLSVMQYFAIKVSSALRISKCLHIEMLPLVSLLILQCFCFSLFRGMFFVWWKFRKCVFLFISVLDAVP